MNAYVRLKLALTEDKPTIKPYDESAWAELADSKSAPIEASQTIIRCAARAMGQAVAIAEGGRFFAKAGAPG